MTASEKAKQAGCKNLKEVAIASGISTQTLNNWFKYRRWTFDAVVEKVAREMKR